MVALHINHLAVIAASVVYFIIGGLWFSPILFSKVWQELIGLTEEKKQERLKKNNMGFLLGMSFVAGLVASYALACIIGAFQVNSIVYGALTGLLVGVSFVFTSTGTSYLFAGRPFKLTLIDAGYPVVALTVAGAILGIWH